MSGVFEVALPTLDQRMHDTTEADGERRKDWGAQLAAQPGPTLKALEKSHHP